MRERQLGQPTTRQSQIAMDVNSANIVTDQSNGEHDKPKEINQKPLVTKKTLGNKLIVHYTHEKRVDSLKREIHQIYHDVFKTHQWKM